MTPSNCQGYRWQPAEDGSGGMEFVEYDENSLQECSIEVPKFVYTKLSAQPRAEWERIVMDYKDEWNSRPAHVTREDWVEYMRLAAERGTFAMMIHFAKKQGLPLPQTLKELQKLDKIKKRLDKMDNARAMRAYNEEPYEEEPLKRIAYRPREIAFVTGWSVQTVYDLIKSGELPAVKTRRAYVVGKGVLMDFLKNGGLLK